MGFWWLWAGCNGVRGGNQGGRGGLGNKMETRRREEACQDQKARTSLFHTRVTQRCAHMVADVGGGDTVDCYGCGPDRQPSGSAAEGLRNGKGTIPLLKIPHPQGRQFPRLGSGVDTFWGVAVG